MAETTEQYRTRINQLKLSIENEPRIKNMRDDIAEGIGKTGNRQADIETQFQSVIDETTGKDVISAPEIIAARNGEANLDARLDKKEQEFEIELARNMLNDEQLRAYVELLQQQVTNMGSISPEPYATYAQLEAAHPNGDDNIYVITADGNWYYWNSFALKWDIGGKFQSSGIADRTVSPRKTTMYEREKGNWFNKSDVRNGYINATGFVANETWRSNATPVDVLPSTKYTVRLFDTNGGYLSFLDEKGEFIISNPFQGAAGTSVTIVSPSNAATAIANIPYKWLDTFTLTEGDDPEYDVTYKGQYKLKKAYLPSKIKNYYEVSKTGNADFKTIQEAINYVVDGATIFIYPGDYFESLDMKGKRLHLIAYSPDITRVISSSNLRDAPPLEAAKGTISGLTFYAWRPEGEAIPEHATPYAAHIDYDESADQSLVFDTCYFVSDWNAAVGIGMRKGFALEFKNCRMTSKYANQGALFFHDSTNESLAGRYTLVVDNCRISAAGKYAMMVMSIGYAANDLQLHLRNNTFYSDVNGVSDFSIGVSTPSASYPQSVGDGFLGTGTIHLHESSHGNNVSCTNTKTEFKKELTRLDTEKANKKQEEWITPTLLNGWVAVNQDTTPVKFMKDEMGFVHVKGRVSGGTLTSCFQFPVGYRTEGLITLPVWGATRIELPSNGYLSIVGQTGQVSLDNVIFKAER